MLALRRLSSLLLLAAVLIALAVFFAPGAQSAQAQTTATTIWSATLTVKDITGHGAFAAGCNNTIAGSRCRSTSVLTDDDFTYNNVEYHVTHASAGSRSLQIRLNKAIPADLKAGLTLHVGNNLFPLADARLTPTGAQVNWYNTGLDWSVGDTVQLSLTEVVGPPTVSFSASPNPVDEGDSVTITATLSSALERGVVIPLTVTDSTAEPGDHGMLSSITINAGATRGAGTISTAHDEGDDHEIFTVSLGTLPSGIDPGARTSVRVTIRDDEAPDAVWDATLTVAEAVGASAVGCLDAGSNAEIFCSTSDVLSDHDFTYDGADYAVVQLTLSTDGPLFLRLDKAMPPDLKGSLILVVDGVRFPLTFAIMQQLGTGALWNNSGLTWTLGDTVQVSLIELPIDVAYWSPTLNVGDTGGGGRGCREGSGAECSAEGVLTDPDFRYTRIISDYPGGQYTWNFDVRELYRTDGNHRNELVLVTSSRIPDGFVLTVVDPRTGEDTPRRFPLEQARRSVVRNGNQARWTYDGVRWGTPNQNGRPSTTLTLGLERPRAGLHYIQVHYDGGVSNDNPNGVDNFRHFVAANRTRYGYTTDVPSEFISIDPDYAHNPVATTHVRLRVYADNPGSTLRVGGVRFNNDGTWRATNLRTVTGGAPSHNIALDKSNIYTHVSIEVTDGDVTKTYWLAIDPPPRTYSLTPTARVVEGQSAALTLTLSEPAPATGAEFTVSVAAGTASADDVGAVASSVTVSAGDTTASIAVPTVDDDEVEEEERFTVKVAPARPGWGLDPDGTDTATVTIEDNDHAQSPYAELIAQMREWRNDPQWVRYQAHTDRWDRALKAFGEEVADTSLTEMSAAEAQGYADRGWTRWVEVAKALREIEAAAQPQQDQQQQTPNRAPAVSSAIADATFVRESGIREVSLSGVFADADGDDLSISASSSDTSKVAVSASSDGSSLTLVALARGRATITVTATDGNGGAAVDDFTVTVKSAPTAASGVADVTGLEVGAAQDIFLSGVFSDPDGDALTISAASSNEARATVSAASDGSALTLTAVSAGEATITVTARDSDGNTVSDSFNVSVTSPPEQAPVAETPDIVARYDANGDGKIDGSEWRQARQDFLTGKITYSEMTEVYTAYLASTG